MKLLFLQYNALVSKFRFTFERIFPSGLINAHTLEYEVFIAVNSSAYVTYHLYRIMAMTQNCGISNGGLPLLWDTVRTGRKIRLECTPLGGLKKIHLSKPSIKRERAVHHLNRTALSHCNVRYTRINLRRRCSSRLREPCTIWKDIGFFSSSNTADENILCDYFFITRSSSSLRLRLSAHRGNVMRPDLK